jgi:hypothetical protein
VRLFLIAAAAAASAWVGATLATAHPAAGCPASVVHYQAAKHPTSGDMPWVLARPRAPGVAAFLPSYARSLRDGRVSRSDGLVLWQRGERVVWTLPGTVTAWRLDGPGRFTLRGPSVRLAFPTPGCWRLTVRGTSVVARVVANPPSLECDATPAPPGQLVPVRPLRARLAAGWTWRTEQGGLLMYTHGVGPNDLNAKVLWWAGHDFGGALRLTGIRLDAPGRFRQTFQQAGTSSSPPGYKAPFPSIVDVPRPGCWLFRLRTGKVAGVLVVQAVDRPG